MQKTYEESLRLVTRDCDMFGRWRPSAALEAMQEAAGTHAALLGVGREELIRAHNVVWVLSRAALTLARCPAIGERVTVGTFPHPCLRFFYPRYFVFYDEARRRIGAAGTLWALVDLSTRRPASVPAVAERLPDNRDIPAPLELPRAVPKLAGQERLFTREPAFTELDVNGHVNNARYAAGRAGPAAAQGADAHLRAGALFQRDPARRAAGHAPGDGGGRLLPVRQQRRPRAL